MSHSQPCLTTVAVTVSSLPTCQSCVGRSRTARHAATSTVDTAGPWRPAPSCGHSKRGERSRGLRACLPEAGNPEASDGATCQDECVNRAFLFSIFADALMSWGLVDLGRDGVSPEPTPPPTSLIKLSHTKSVSPLGQVLDN